MKKLLLIIAAVYLSGCAGTVAMKPEQRANIHTVAINKDVTAPKPTIYNSGVTAGAAVGGAIGALIVSSNTDTSQEEQYFLSNNIDIKEIFRQDLINELTARNLFTLTDSDKADTTISITITNYGFWLGGKFLNFDIVRPTLYAQLSFSDASGKEIWRGVDFVGNMSSMTNEVSITDVMKNPKLAEMSLRQASKLVAKLLVAHVEGREVPDEEKSSLKLSESELLTAAQ